MSRTPPRRSAACHACPARWEAVRHEAGETPSHGTRRLRGSPPAFSRPPRGHRDARWPSQRRSRTPVPPPPQPATRRPQRPKRAVRLPHPSDGAEHAGHQFSMRRGGGVRAIRVPRDRRAFVGTRFPQRAISGLESRPAASDARKEFAGVSIRCGLVRVATVARSTVPTPLGGSAASFHFVSARTRSGSARQPALPRRRSEMPSTALLEAMSKYNPRQRGSLERHVKAASHAGGRRPALDVSRARQGPPFGGGERTVIDGLAGLGITEARRDRRGLLDLAVRFP